MEARVASVKKVSSPVIGDRLREARKARGLSMQNVADRAKISVATLSRIETDKQGVDLELFLQLTRILGCSAGEMLNEDSADGKPTEHLAERIGSLPATDRTRLWRRLAVESREKKPNYRSAKVRDVAVQVEEVLAQVEFVRAEIESVKKRLRK